MQAAIIRAVAGVAFALGLQLSAARACPPLPVTLADGTTAHAGDVMTDLGSILSCPLFTGNIGVGTTTPLYNIDVVGDVRATETSSQPDGFIVYGASQPLYATYNTGQSTNQHWAEFGDLSGQFVGRFMNDGYTSGSNWLVVSRNTGTYTTQYVIFPTGNVGIGTSTPGYLLQVAGAVGATNFYNTSDGRLKTDITTIPDALSTIERLRGVEYYWRPAGDRPVGKTLALPLGQKQVGFVAQEVEKVVPEAVGTPAPGSDGVYGVNEGKIVAILVEAVKEQQLEIDQLKAQIAAAKK